MKQLPISYAYDAKHVQSLKKKYLQFATMAIPLVVIPLFFVLTAPVEQQESRTAVPLSVPNPLEVSPEVENTSSSVDQGREVVPWRIYEPRCNFSVGKWVRHEGKGYYTNSTCSLIPDQLNCFMFGRTDSDFLKWRWRPDGCELPLFDARQFLELVRGKKLAFVGDSLGRNQMHSLQCLLSGVDFPQDNTKDGYFPRWYFPVHDFTMATFWAPALVKVLDSESDIKGRTLTNTMTVELDQPEPSWASEIEDFDYVIVTAGPWLFRRQAYIENGQLKGCSEEDSCEEDRNITALGRFYGIRRAFRTAFQMLIRSKNYRGMTFLATYSPQHYENGEWNTGGTCRRTGPFIEGEASLMMHEMRTYSAQVEEFRMAQEAAREKGLKFRLLDTTKMMLMRPDGHPNFNGRSLQRNMSRADCVHWCLPGPIDAWNELLQYYLIEASVDNYAI
ncbi:hypothetical protein MLD38_001537 [Melastoma candidum]|uniref:Uncharacterized protein n=1 Tax=Melastoma candidum TaxID=119954 RepID=A0ACB9SIG8_9MYRT|nr:hypothetical protein MLD38_001537 [Melastoma candidum]